MPFHIPSLSDIRNPITTSSHFTLRMLSKTHDHSHNTYSISFSSCTTAFQFFFLQSCMLPLSHSVIVWHSEPFTTSSHFTFSILHTNCSYYNYSIWVSYKFHYFSHRSRACFILFCLTSLSRALLHSLQNNVNSSIDSFSRFHSDSGENWDLRDY